MNFTAGEWTDLYVLYEAYSDQLKRDVIASNKSLGSKTPEKTWMEKLGREAFETLVKDSIDIDVTKRWIRRIIRNHESQFPQTFLAQIQED